MRTDILISLLCESPLSGVYVFGSWVRRKDPQDVDLLIIYNPECCPIELAIHLRRQIVETASRALGLPAHTILLTVAEEKQVDFCASESCVPFLEVLAIRGALGEIGN